MRILIHTQFYPPEMGAPQARLSDLALRLKRFGHEVKILTAMPNYPTGRIFEGYSGFYRQEVRDGINVYRSWIIPSKSQSLLHRLISYLSFCLSSLLTGILKAGKEDVIITESPPLFLAAAGWMLALIKRARWILNVSDLWPDSAKYIGMLNERSFAYRLMEGLADFLYRKAWLETGQSNEIIAGIKKKVPAARVYHLSNGVDVKSFSPDLRNDGIRRKYLRNGEVGFVFAGLHGLFQGLDQVIMAAEQLKNEQVRFIFIGDGAEKEALMKRSRELNLPNVDFYPPVSHNEVPSILASMDAALITLKSSITGAVPSKIYEAMASGIPVLLVSGGEARDIAINARAGIAVVPGDINGLIRSVRELASRPELRKEMGAAGRISAMNFYDREAIAERFDAVIR